MRLPTWLRQHLAALRALLVLTVLTGVLYPLAVTGIAQLPGLRDKANGSLVSYQGRVVGSALIGQSFVDGAGHPLPRYFQSRPSAAGYDPTATAASNLGPESADLLALVNQRRADVAALEGVDPAAVPPDALTASGSGLDNGISVAYATLQAPRVARARGMSVPDVLSLVDSHTVGRPLGFMGEPYVNVLLLNLDLDRR
jgi:potassium-transporting ATPase KdpC subunit